MTKLIKKLILELTHEEKLIIAEFLSRHLEDDQLFADVPGGIIPSSVLDDDEDRTPLTEDELKVITLNKVLDSIYSGKHWYGACKAFDISYDEFVTDYKRLGLPYSAVIKSLEAFISHTILLMEDPKMNAFTLQDMIRDAKKEMLKWN